MLLLLLVLVTSTVGVTGADSKKPYVDRLEPPELNDDLGSKADANSNIDFFHSTGKGDYKAGKDGEPVTMVMTSWFYDMSAGIARSALSSAFPFETFSIVLDGEIQAISWKQTAKDYVGFFTAIAVGIVLLLVVPIAAISFCCCRCFNKCGGRRRFDNPYEAGYKAHCGRSTTIILFTIPLLFAITGTVLMFLANHNLTTQLNNLKDDGLDKIDDIGTFLDNTVDQAQLAIFGKYNFTTDVIKRDLHNIGFLVGQPIRSDVLTTTALDVIYDRIIEMEEDAQSILKLLEETKGLKKDYEDNSKKIANEFIGGNFRTSVKKATTSFTFPEGETYLKKMDNGQKIELVDVEPTIKKLKKFIDAGIRSFVEKVST
ncbi:prominin 1a [Elysia marginata]|uniref:Prominin 1a n=1 Tax=Elysia marginata TaxID=1093978 RepID=A0AAV4IZX4_9GAST|nr:prominin 1a [Elysia marginata]